MKMIPADIFQPLPDRAHLSGGDPIDGDIKHVKNQYPEDQQGGNQRHHRIRIGPHPVDGQAGQDKSDNGAAGVPQKNSGLAAGAKIIRHKAQASAHDGDGQPADQGLSCLIGDHAQKKRDNDTQPGGQAVHAVKKIQGVGYTDNPQEGQAQIDQGRGHAQLHGRGAQDDPLADDDRHGPDLRPQFNRRRHSFYVIGQPDEKKQHGGRQNGGNARVENAVDENGN